MCYEDLRSLYAATAEERDELRKENEQLKEICEKQAEMNGRIAAMALELDEAKAERDELLRILREQAECEHCKHDTMILPCADKEYIICPPDCDLEKCVCCGCGGANWEWRGLEGRDG